MKTKTKSSIFLLAITCSILASVAMAQPIYNIEHLSTRMFTISPTDGVIRDSLLFLVGNDQDRNARFAVYDIGTPTAPVERGYAVLPFSSPQSIILAEGIAFIMHPGGVGLFDISDLWHIRLLNSIEVERPFSMALRDNVLYLSRSENLLNVYSFTGDNHQVELLDEIDVGDTLRCMTTYEDKLLAGGRQFKVYSLDDPSSPNLIGMIDSTAFDIVVKDNHAYVARNQEGVSIYLLSDNDDPEFRNRIRISDALDLALWQGDLMVSQSTQWDDDGCPMGQILVCNLDNPSSPRQFGYSNSPQPGSFTWVPYQTAMIAGNSPVCLITTYSWLLEFNQRNNDYYVTQFAGLGGGDDRSIVIAGRYLYALRPQGNKMLYCFDISNPENLVQVSAISKNCYFVASTEHHLFTWEEVRRNVIELRAYEVGAGGSLRQVGSLAEPNIRADWRYYQGRIFDGYMLCEASSFNGFVEIDIRNPARMTKIEYHTEHDFGTWAFDTDRRIIYAITNEWEDQQFDDGIMRLDISDRQNPIEYELIERERLLRPYLYENERLYVRENGNILIYDVSNLNEFTLIGTIDDAESIIPVSIRDNKLIGYTFATDENSNSTGYTLRIWNVLNPDFVIGIGAYPRGGRYGDGRYAQLQLQDNLLISNNIYSVDFFDISRALLTPDEPSKDLPQEFSLSAFPNPFNSTTTISFSVGAYCNTPLRLAIYDINGRIVADLLDGRGVSRNAPTAGEHKIVWDASGVGAGIYFVRLEAGKILTQKVVLIR